MGYTTEEMQKLRETRFKQAQARNRVFDLYIQTIDDESTMMEVAELYPTWESLIGQTITLGLIFQYGVNAFGDPQLYKAVGTEHNAATHWPPSTASLYKAVGFAQGYPIWTQPLGAHDAYDLNDIVMHNGELWISIHNGKNTWAPGVYGWNKK